MTALRHGKVKLLGLSPFPQELHELMDYSLKHGREQGGQGTNAQFEPKNDDVMCCFIVFFFLNALMFLLVPSAFASITPIVSLKCQQNCEYF